MKQLKLREAPVPAKGEEAPKGRPVTCTAELIRMAMNVLPPGGLSTDEQRKRFRVLNALDDAKNGVLNLEDADFKTLSDVVLDPKLQWGWLGKEIIEFDDDVREAGKEEEKVKKSK